MPPSPGERPDLHRQLIQELTGIRLGLHLLELQLRRDPAARLLLRNSRHRRPPTAVEVLRVASASIQPVSPVSL
jgi:hypothetical protein